MGSSSDNFRVGTLDQFIYTGDYEEGLKYFNENLKNIEEDNPLQLKKIELLRLSGNYDKALKKISNLSHVKSLNIPLVISKAYVYWNLGELDRANELLDIIQTNLEQMTDTPDQLMYQARMNIVRGNIAWSSGKFNIALEHTKLAYEIYTDQQDIYHITHALHNLGAISWSIGELRQAEDYFQKCLKLERQFNNNYMMAFTLNNLGNLFFLKGDYQQAEVYLLDSFNMRKKRINTYDLSESFLSLISFYLYTDNFDQATKMLDQFDELLHEMRETSKIMRTRYNYCQALWLKHGPRMFDKVQAMQQLYKLLDDEVVEFNLTYEAIKHLLQLLLEELKFYGEEVVLEEINSLLNRLSQISDTNPSHPSVVENKILQAKLAFIEGKVITSSRLLDEGLELAKTKGLEQYLKQIEDEKIRLQNEFEAMVDLIENNATYAERMERIELENYIDKLTKFSRN